MTMYDKSLLLPPERQKKNAGGIILKQVLKAISKPSTSKAKTISTELKEKYDPSELEEMAESFVTAVENNTKMTSRGTVSLKTPLSNIAKEAADILNKDRDATKNFIDSKDIIKISRLDDLRAGGGGKTGAACLFAGRGGREATGGFDRARTLPALTAHGIADLGLMFCPFHTSTAKEVCGLSRVRRN